MKAVIASLLSLALFGSAIPVMAATDTECKSNWEKADANKDGTLDGTEVSTYLDAIKSKGKTYDANSDGKLTSVEFTEACKADTFKDMKS